jgi:hypothetical protein
MNEVTGSKPQNIFSNLLSGVFGTLLIFLIIISVLIYMFGSVVNPGEMGIRQVTFGPSQGFNKRALGPGYHWSIPFYSKIHFVPQTVQQFHMHRDGENEHDSGRTLEVQTTDGSSVNVDITVWYKFFSEAGEAHGGPVELLTQVGRRNDWDTHIQTVVTSEIKKSLGRLSTSEFYNPMLREKEIDIAKTEMNKRLALDGIEVEAVLLRRYTYKEERIDRAIFEKNLQDQEERLNAAGSRLAQAKAALEKVAAEWDAKIETLKVEGENKANVLKSEANLYEKSKIAEGDLLLAQATAEVERKKALLLSESAGSDVFVAKELAPLLASLKGGVVSEMDPYDLDEWMKRLGVGEQAK